MSDLRIGVVIVHWRGFEDTLECLQSIAALEPAPAAIVAAVNGPGDFDEAAARQVCPRLFVVTATENQGYAAACNRGWRAIDDAVDIVLFLNNDVVLDRGLLATLAKAFDSPDVGVAGPPVVYYDDPARVWAMGGRINRALGYTRHVGLDRGMTPRTGQYVDYANGSAIATRVELLRRLNGWEESYFHFWDEVDLCERARLMGSRSFASEGATVRHKVSASTGHRGSARFNRAQAYYFVRNRMRFFARQGRGWQRFTSVAAQPLLLVYECVQALIRRNPDDARGRIEGFVDGVRGRSGQRRGGW